MGNERSKTQASYRSSVKTPSASFSRRVKKLRRRAVRRNTRDFLPSKRLWFIANHQHKEENKLKKILCAALCALLIASFTLASAELWNPYSDTAYTKYGWVRTACTVDDGHHLTVGVVLAGDNKETTYTTTTAFDNYNDQSLHYQSEAYRDLLTEDAFIEILFNEKDEVIGFERILGAVTTAKGMNKGRYYHDSMKYGGELTAPGGKAGNMVASGWVLSHTDNTITVGDGNHVANSFEETYTFADDVKIFLVDNDYFTLEGEPVEGSWVSEYGTVADIVDTPKNEDGEIYWRPERYIAMAIFDQSAVDEQTGKTRVDVSDARVTELYLYKNMMQESSVTAPDDVGYNGTSWMPGVDKSVGKTGYGWNGAVTPFVAQDDRLYSVGDAFTNIFLYVSDADETGDKTLTILDMGNAIAAYQYYLNIERMGYDPRDVDNILLTHGHGDHYGAMWEINTMVNRAHGYDKLKVYTSGADQAGYLYGLYTGITLNDIPVRYCVDHFNEWYTWMDLGKGVSAYAIPTPGHANDVASFIFLMDVVENDTYFNRENDDPKKVAWVYMGGYGGGAATKASNGYTKLQYINSMRYMQSVVTPFAESVADYIYNLPQHADQGPWYEISKLVRMKNAQDGANYHFLDGWVEGREGVFSLMEKRSSAYSYSWMDSAWQATKATNGDVPVDLYDQIIVPYLREAGYNWYTTPQNKNTEVTEVYGPFKREAGTYDITIDSVIILHGYDAFQNKNDLFKGMTNIYGWDVSQGVSVDKDSHAHDPNGWYVQVVAKVDDDYIGGVYFSEEDAIKIAKLDGKQEAYPVNWNAASYTDFEGNAVVPNSGPVESMFSEDWSEIIRTQRLNSKEEAEALESYLNDLLAKGQNKFKVTVTAGNDVKLPEGYISAANAPLDDPFLTSLNDDDIKVTFPGTGYYTLEEEPLVIERCMELNKDIDLTSMFVPVN